MQRKQKTKKSAQEVQDEIFRKMAADEKVALGAALWRLGRDLVGDKFSHDTKRPKTSFGEDRRNS